ncbi:SAM-dependent methyltransferase [Actinomycetes bacterium KLBMP 9759]
MEPLVPGSYLVLGDGINTNPRMREGMKINGYTLRTLEQLHECYDGLELVEPGLVPAPEWRPDADGPPVVMDLPAICGVGRKP